MYTPNRGRFAVAARNIEVGECIIHEDAIVNNVKFQFSLSHCYNCNKDTSFRPLPCERCAAIVFCSNECKLKADFGYELKLNFYTNFFDILTGLSLTNVNNYKFELTFSFSRNQLRCMQPQIRLSFVDL